METQIVTDTKINDITMIELNKKYLSIITSYLKKNKYSYSVSENENKKGKIRVSIHALNPEAAFYLGVNTQVQLIDGEMLI